MELRFEWPERTSDQPAFSISEIEAPFTVATVSSIWVVQLEGYIRLPRDGASRDAPESIDGRTFVDGALIPFRSSSFFQEGFGWHLQLVPSDRPKDALGIHTGVIERASTNR